MADAEQRRSRMVAIGYQAERWLTESVGGVVLADEIRDRGAGAAPLVLQRLVDELPPFFDPAELYRLPLPVPDRWDLEEEPGLVPASTALMWEMLLPDRWVCDEAIAAALDVRLIALPSSSRAPRNPRKWSQRACGS